RARVDGDAIADHRVAHARAGSDLGAAPDDRALDGGARLNGRAVTDARWGDDRGAWINARIAAEQHAVANDRALARREPHAAFERVAVDAPVFRGRADVAPIRVLHHPEEALLRAQQMREHLLAEIVERVRRDVF